MPSGSRLWLMAGLRVKPASEKGIRGAAGVLGVPIRSIAVAIATVGAHHLFRETRGTTPTPLFENRNAGTEQPA